WFLPVASTLYDGAVAYTDQHLGRLLDTLRERGLYDTSWIVVLADHGEGWADHEGFVGHGFGHLYEEQVWVPLLIKPPRGAGIAPRRVRAPVSLLDVAPTLADFLELPAPEDLRGRSLRPYLT